MVNNMDEVTIYTDGACSGNPGPGGWGAILMLGENRKEIYIHYLINIPFFNIYVLHYFSIYVKILS